MLRAAVTALATFVFSVVIAGVLVFNASTAFGQTSTPNPTDTPTTTPTKSVTPTPQEPVGGENVVPTGAPNTGRGGN